MKSSPKLAASIALAIITLAPNAATPASARQTAQPAQKKEESQKTDAPRPPAKAGEERLEPDDARPARGGVPDETVANRREGAREDDESEVVYYNNFLTSYRLGPEDVISVKVFGLERYDKLNITVPPDGRIDYYFVKEGLHVAGKTTQQVRDEITQHLDEYIIEPRVTVSLEKAMSARYYVVGDVAQPGIRVMSRRLSAYEAIIESGGVLPTGDKKRVTVSRLTREGMRELVTVDISAIEKSKSPDNYFLRPGDVVIVPGNRYKTVKKVLDLLPVLSFARIFTGGF